MKLEEFKDVLIKHTDRDSEDHDNLAAALNSYVAESQSDHKLLVAAFTRHIEEVDASHAKLLKMLDAE